MSYPSCVVLMFRLVTGDRNNRIPGQPELNHVTVAFVIVPIGSVELSTRANKSRNFVCDFIDRVSMNFKESIVAVDGITEWCLSKRAASCGR